jgi:hypothetical protein
VRAQLWWECDWKNPRTSAAAAGVISPRGRLMQSDQAGRARRRTPDALGGVTDRTPTESELREAVADRARRRIDSPSPALG